MVRGYDPPAEDSSRAPVGIGRMGDSSHPDDLSRLSTEHRVRRLVGSGASPKSPSSKRRFVRDLVLIGAVVVLTVLIVPFADVENPDFAEAQAHAAGLQASFERVWRGDASLESAAAAEGLRVYEYRLGERTVSVAVHPEPTAAGICYGMRTGGGLVTSAVRFVATYDCVSPPRSSFQVVGTWGEVLPSERVTPGWFVPGLITLIACVVVLTTRNILKLLLR